MSNVTGHGGSRGFSRAPAVLLLMLICAVMGLAVPSVCISGPSPTHVMPAAKYSSMLPPSVRRRMGFDPGPVWMFSPHTDDVFVPDRVYAANVWAAFVFLWPWWGGLIAAVLLLIAGWRCWWIRRYPRPPGATYCRRCNYCLTGIQRDTCPECGKTLTAGMRIAGRSLRRRLMWPMLIMMPVAGYLVMLGCGVPRYGWMSHWFVWPSIRLDQWETHYQYGPVWSSHDGVEMARTRQIDLRSGKVVATPIQHIYHRAFFGSAFTPDGRRLVFVRHGKQASLKVWDIKRRRMVRSFKPKQLSPLRGDHAGGLELRFPPGHDELLTIRKESREDPSGKPIMPLKHVIRWNLATGQVHQVTGGGGWAARFPEYRRIATNDRFFAGADFEGDGWGWLAYPNHVVTAKGKTVLHLKHREWIGYASEAVSPSGKRLFIYADGKKVDGQKGPLVEIDLPDGKVTSHSWPDPVKKVVNQRWWTDHSVPHYLKERCLLGPAEGLWCRRIDGKLWLIAAIAHYVSSTPQKMLSKQPFHSQLWAYDVDGDHWQRLLKFAMQTSSQIELAGDDHVWVLWNDSKRRVSKRRVQVRGYDLEGMLKRNP